MVLSVGQMLRPPADWRPLSSPDWSILVEAAGRLVLKVGVVKLLGGCETPRRVALQRLLSAQQNNQVVEFSCVAQGSKDKWDLGRVFVWCVEDRSWYRSGPIRAAYYSTLLFDQLYVELLFVVFGDSTSIVKGGVFEGGRRLTSIAIFHFIDLSRRK